MPGQARLLVLPRGGDDASLRAAVRAAGGGGEGGGVIPNRHGVYETNEALTLPYQRKGWRGLPLAEIRIARTDEGWRAATSFAFMTGNHWGSSSPISRHSIPYATRDDAVNAAVARLRDRLSRATHVIEPAMEPQRRHMLEWLDDLLPAQRDLFGNGA